MMETIHVPSGLGKKERYEKLLPQIFALIEGETDLIANLANIAAALKEGMGFFWVGFYLVRKPLLAGKKSGVRAEGDSQGELVLGPFQGPVACTRIKYGKGVCGQAWAQRRVLIVSDVEQFAGHIACSARTRSEVVLPFYFQPEMEGTSRPVMGVLDVDSEVLNDFDETDAKFLSALLEKLVN